MKSFKMALVALASAFTFSIAHADGIHQHIIQIQGGLPAMLVFVGTETPMSAYQNPDHPELVRYVWEKTDGTDAKEGTYDDYYYCNSTKPNQPIEQMQCEADLDKRGAAYQLFKNEPGRDK